MTSNYYSFIKEEDNDVEYTFYSEINDIIYNVTFSIDDYSLYLNDFPHFYKTVIHLDSDQKNSLKKTQKKTI